MNKTISIISLVLIITLGVVSLGSYFGTPMCCGQCDSSIISSGSEGEMCIGQLTMMFHRLSMISDYSNAIFSLTSFGFLSLLSFFGLKYVFWLMIRVDIFRYYIFLHKKRFLKFNMKLFHFYLSMLSKGIIGSQKHFA